MLLENAIRYANDVITGKEITTKEVKKQCEWFLRDLERKDDWDYYFDYNELKKIEEILKLLNFATGIGVIGKPILYGLYDFQAFFLTNIFGFRCKDNPKKFKHRDVTLFIPRKNAKTMILAVIELILMLTEAEYSEFYSICIDRDLAGEVKKAMTQIINASPYIKKRFKTTTTLNGKITCLLTNSYYQARTAESGRNNAIRPATFIADEIGNFRDYNNITAMKSGQLSVINPLMFKATTAYAINDSIMIEELEYIRKVYSGVIKDENMFALLYYAEEEHKWDDIGLKMSNPLRIPENYDEIKKNREKTLNKPQEQTEFLTKHMNIFVNSDQDEPYLIYDEWIKCRVDDIDFTGKEVVVGVDLSITTDLTAVSIMYKENGKYYCMSHGFLPKDTLNNRREKIDYRQMERMGYCTLINGLTVNYNAVEQYIRNIENTYNCRIKSIISDPFNAKQMMENLSNDYEVVLIKQTYTNLSAPTKEFRNEVYNSNIYYKENKLLDWNISNCSLEVGKAEDVMLKKKNKNKMRIDMAVVLIFAFKELYLTENKVDLNKKILADDFYM